MAKRCAGLCRGGQGGGNAGEHLQLHLQPVRIAGFVQGFQHGGGHGEHARVTGGHHHHAAAAGRQLEGMARPLQFLAVVGAVRDLIGAQRAGHADIGFVAQQVLGFVQRLARRRHHELGGTGAEADHRQPAARLADQRRVLGRVGKIEADAIRLLVQDGQGGFIGDEAQRYAELGGGGGQFGVDHALPLRQQAGQRLWRQAGGRERL
ncbi:hypothetical protein D9M71_612830 [compost metagenome]